MRSLTRCKRCSWQWFRRELEGGGAAALPKPREWCRSVLAARTRSPARHQSRRAEAMSRREELGNLATYLKTFRERARLSVEDVASGVGCTAWYIERIEEGSRYHRRPARERLQRICELVGADYDEARRLGGYS